MEPKFLNIFNKISQLKSSPICGKEQPLEKKSNSYQKVAQFVV